MTTGRQLQTPTSQWKGGAYVTRDEVTNLDQFARDAAFRVTESALAASLVVKEARSTDELVRLLDVLGIEYVPDVVAAVNN